MNEVPTKFKNNSEQMVSEGDFHRHGEIIVIMVIIWLEYMYNIELSICVLTILHTHTHTPIRTIFGSQNAY